MEYIRNTIWKKRMNPDMLTPPKFCFIKRILKEREGKGKVKIPNSATKRNQGSEQDKGEWKDTQKKETKKSMRR